jgi:hypothetical protein
MLMAATMALLTVACGRDTYQAFYYPNRSDLTRYTAGPVYNTEAEARQWIRQHAAERRDPDPDHEIGKNCRSPTGTFVRICEDTFK